MKRKKYLILGALTFILSFNPLTAKAAEPVTFAESVTLSEDLQNHIIYVSENYNVSPGLIASVIEKESSFYSDATNGTHLGLMQVTEKWHHDRMERLNCMNLYDPYQNIIVGTDFLSELIKRYNGDETLALMAYNMGPAKAEELYNQGIISEYASSIMQRKTEICY